MIYINDIPSFRNPETFEMNIDDRIEKIELINGNAIQDYGHFETGDSFTVDCVFEFSNYLRLRDLWIRRELVTFTDEGGYVWQNMRLIFQRIKYLARYPNYVELTFELWRI